VLRGKRIFDYIKMDVEGHELPALRGAKMLLKRCKTAILQIEIYEKYLTSTLNELEKTFDHIYLVCYCEMNGKLYLTKNFRKAPLKGFKNMPPNYICSHWCLEERGLGCFGFYLLEMFLLRMYSSIRKLVKPTLQE
jgi:hypothetical protein